MARVARNPTHKQGCCRDRRVALNDFYRFYCELSDLPNPGATHHLDRTVTQANTMATIRYIAPSVYFQPFPLMKCCLQYAPDYYIVSHDEIIKHWKKHFSKR